MGEGQASARARRELAREGYAEQRPAGGHTRRGEWRRRNESTGGRVLLHRTERARLKGVQTREAHARLYAPFCIPASFTFLLSFKLHTFLVYFLCSCAFISFSLLLFFRYFSSSILFFIALV